MIAVIPFAAGLLGVLSDREDQNTEELLRRAVLLDNGSVFFEGLGMTEEQAATFMDKLYDEWRLDPSVRRSTGDTLERMKVFGVLFNGVPNFTIFRRTGFIRLPAERLSSEDPSGRHVVFSRGWDHQFEPSPDYDDVVEQEVLRRKIYTSGTILDSIDEARFQFPDLTFWQMVYEARKYGLSFAKIPDTMDEPWHHWYTLEKGR